MKKSCLRLKTASLLAMQDCLHYKPIDINQALPDDKPVHDLKSSKSRPAFSLVEMLMALLVASLLLAALAPVMTKKANENVNINGTFNPKDTTTKKEIIFGSTECPEDSLKTDADGSQYCEGTYTVPPEYTGVIRVTVIGAGGGGGGAPTAGFTEYKEAGNTNTFTVPAMVNKLEATLISGGAGGGGGGIAEKTETFVISGTPSGDNGTITRTSSGEGVWKPSTALDSAWVKISACGGGGGGVIGAVYSPTDDFVNPGHGAYFANKMFKLPSNASSGLSYRIGGQGGYYTYPSAGGGSPELNGGAAAPYMERGCVNKAKGGNGNDASGDGSNNCCQTTSTATPGDNSPLCIANGGIAPRGAGSGGRGGKGPIEHSWGSGSSGGGAGSLSGFGGNGGEGSHSAPAGAGGGGSTWLGGTLANPTSMVFQVGGGGGGAGPASNFGSPAVFTAGGGGGGGAGMAGYEGGNGAGASLGTGGIPATSGGGASLSPIFGIGYCLGGTSGRNESTVSPSAAEGKNGAMRISYLDYGPGASGGGAGNIVPVQKISVSENALINIKIGRGGSGGNAGSIDSAGSIKRPSVGSPCSLGNNEEEAVATQLTDKNGNILLTTFASHYMGGWGGHPLGVVRGIRYANWQEDQAGAGGAKISGVLLPNPPYQTSVNDTKEAVGFDAKNGRTAGDKEERGYKVYPDGTTGGRGGTLITPWYTCSPGAGGTKDNKDGKDGGAGGCGGGGGYGFGKGGKGGAGYARLSWNKYWDAALNGGRGAYTLSNIGTGGGGASGNIMTYSIKVMGGQNIRIRIGKGGQGASIVNNTIVDAKKGGDTVFGDTAVGELKAGGGEGGKNPAITNNTFINGIGGNTSSVCHYGSKSFLNNKAYCTKGTKGFNAEISADANSNAIGAKGASLTNYGTGGEGGISGTNSYLGKNAAGFGSGGGGAAIHDLGENSVNSTTGENKGGDGSNGKIIIELYDL